jgi:hypothetical protein
VRAPAHAQRPSPPLPPPPPLSALPLTTATLQRALCEHCVWNPRLFVSPHLARCLSHWLAAPSSPSRHLAFSRRRYLFEHYFTPGSGEGAFDWLVYGGDERTVVVENLVAYLGSEALDALDRAGAPLFLGRRFVYDGTLHAPPGLVFNSGAAGYVLNRRALQLLIGALDTPLCLPRLRTHEEDVMLAHCLRTVGITPHDTRDGLGRERFLPFAPSQHLRIARGPDDWYFRYSIGLKYGVDCCSTSAIGFHNLGAADVHRAHALLYLCRGQEHNETQL